MTRRIKDLKGGKNVIPQGEYKLQAKDFKAKMGPSGPLAIIDFMVVGPAHQSALFGQHTELAFSTASEGVMKSWLLALGFSEDDEVPEEIFSDTDALESWLRTNCKDAVIFASVIKVKDKTGQYENNQVEKPWENVGVSQLGDGDYAVNTDEIPF
jgi:hypothetical protein